MFGFNVKVIIDNTSILFDFDRYVDAVIGRIVYYSVMVVMLGITVNV